MKKNKWIVVFIIFLFIAIGIGIYFYYARNNNNNSDYTAERTSNNNEVNNNSNAASENNNTDSTNPPPSETIKEETLSSFSTKLYSKDSSRQNNIKITCNTLNNTTVNSGETFSFCQTVGQATSSKGYEKADIYDRNGNKKQGLGGGNCQVSSTLYNAVLAVPGLVVTERHEHSNNVPYVKKGLDAAVAYGSYDFKFRNNLTNSIKILASTDDNYVYISLIELKKE